MRNLVPEPGCLRKVVAPGIYHVSSPLIAMIGVFALCALVVYCVVPCGHRAGLHFNNVSHESEKEKKQIASAKLKKTMTFHLAKHGLQWRDVEDPPTHTLERCARVCPWCFTQRTACLVYHSGTPKKWLHAWTH